LFHGPLRRSEVVATAHAAEMQMPLPNLAAVAVVTCLLCAVARPLAESHAQVSWFLSFLGFVVFRRTGR
jgi:hypothetical protein